ncbi:MAG: hypothetical protein ABL916_07480 [Burkholderiaceae bacterium]
MRDYAKVSPQFWTGRTGKALKTAGPEAVIVGMYLMTSPHANMIGVYHCPVAYIAIDTGLTIEGASKGLTSSIEADFCTFDADTDFVFVHEFASYQVGPKLESSDKRCVGVRNALVKVPHGQCRRGFQARYALPFNLPEADESTEVREAPSKPLGCQEQEQEQKKEKRPSDLSARPTIPCPYQSIVDLFHEKLSSLPKVKLMPVGRQKALRKLWGWVLSTSKASGDRRATTAEQALTWIGDYFARAGENDFLMGRGDRSGSHANWRCDIDFLLTDKGLRHVIEKTEAAA